MSEFRLEPQDEHTHRPDNSPNFNESVYVNAFDARQRIGGWMRLGNRVNEGYAELSVCLYLPDGRLACQFQRPRIAGNDAFDAGGLSYRVEAPFIRVSMHYDGELLLLETPELLRDPERMFATARRVPGSVDWYHEGMSPLHGGEPRSAEVQTMYGRDFSLGHFNQHTRVRGSIGIGEQRWAFDGAGWRDHSWGPRYWQSIHYYRLFIANFGGDRGFMLLKITDRNGTSRRVGVLLVDGQYEGVVDMDLLTDWTASRDPARVRLGVRTARRVAIIEGEILSLAPLRNRRRIGEEVLVSRIAEGFTRFSWDGAEGLGMSEYIERIEGEKLAGYPL